MTSAIPDSSSTSRIRALIKGLRSHRQHDRKSRTTAGYTANRNFTVVGLDDLLHQSQSDSAAPDLILPRRLTAEKRSEHRFALGLRNTRPAVADLDHEQPAV